MVSKIVLVERVANLAFYQVNCIENWHKPMFRLAWKDFPKKMRSWKSTFYWKIFWQGQNEADYSCNPTEIVSKSYPLIGGSKYSTVIRKCGYQHTSGACRRQPLYKTFFKGTTYRRRHDVGSCLGVCGIDGHECKAIDSMMVAIKGPNGKCESQGYTHTPGKWKWQSQGNDPGTSLYTALYTPGKWKRRVLFYFLNTSSKSGFETDNPRVTEYVKSWYVQTPYILP